MGFVLGRSRRALSLTGGKAEGSIEIGRRRVLCLLDSQLLGSEVQQVAEAVVIELDIAEANVEEHIAPLLAGGRLDDRENVRESSRNNARIGAVASHRVRLARACTSVRENGRVVTTYGGSDQRTDVGVHVLLRTILVKDFAKGVQFVL